MTIRKALGVVAASAGMALALQGLPAANATVQVPAKVNSCKKLVNKENASDLSPKSQRAWTAFICGGGRLTGGAARMVSGAWIGAPAIIASASGQPITADQKKAWKDWNEGGHNVGRGAALLVSGTWIGAPSTVLDMIKGGATPADLTPAQMRQVSFAMPASSPLAQGFDTPELPELPLPVDPVEMIMELLSL